MVEKEKAKTADDEYESLDLLSCIVKKNASVTRWIYSGIALPAFIVISCGLAGAVIAVALMQIAKFLWPLVSGLSGSLITMNPLVYIALAIVLPVPVYSTVWCLRHRRQKRIEKKLQEDLKCPFGPGDSP